MGLTEDLAYLEQVTKSDLALFFTVNSTVKMEQVALLCNDLGDVVDTLLDSPDSLNVSDPIILQFLKHTLPVLVEIILRRKSVRENENDIHLLLIKVAKLLAGTVSLDIYELCELRNILLIGSYLSDFRFINPKQVHSKQHALTIFSVNSGFYGDYGKANCAIVGRKTVYFWADEWYKVLGGHRAVGHFVEVQVRSPSSDKMVWTGGQVVRYEPAANRYVIEVDHATCSAELPPSEFADSSELTVDLHSTLHLWVDLENKDRLEDSNKKSRANGRLRLKYSAEDVGKFVRIWWSRYERFFYGRVTEYSEGSAQHSLVYEDGEAKAYDMGTKVYELVYPPEEVLLVCAELTGAAQCQAVGKWHSALLAESEADPRSAAHPAPEFSQTIVRPPAGTAISVSEHQMNAINAYFAYGGQDAVFTALASHDRAPPPCKIVLSHVQLAYGLHSMVSSAALKDLSWELKEGVALAMSRYQDAQMKDFQVKDLNDVCLCLRDMMQLVVNSDGGTRKESKLSEFFGSIDSFRMSMSMKLLAAYQLQKRFLGLAMIRDVVDAVYPRIIAFVARRTQVLAQAGKSSSRPPQIQPVVNPQFQLFKTSVSVAALDAWLVDSLVLETIFGESFHQDLAAKSEAVLCYMAHRRLLTERHLDLMWACCSRGAHEAVVRIMHYLFLLVVPVLEPAMRAYLFSLISAVPFKEFSEQLLLLIKTFTLHSLLASREEAGKLGGSPSAPNSPARKQADRLKAQSEGGSSPAAGVTAVRSSTNLRKGLVVSAPQRQWLGFGVLWAFVQDPQSDSDADVDEDLVELAIRYLVELLQEEFKEEREIVMQKCLDNIQHGISVAVSLQILRKVLSLYPSDSKRWFGIARNSISKTVTVAMHIDKLIKQNHLLEIVFDDLESYRRSIEQQHSSSGGAEGSETQGAVVRAVAKAGRVSHIRSVVERLDFLKFIVSKSTLKLSEPQTMILWRTFGEDAVTMETLDRLCIWLDRLICRENKQLSVLLHSLANESDSVNPSSQSHLAALAPRELLDDSLEAGASVFDEGVLVRLFEECILKWAYRSDRVEALSRPAVAHLCLKIFLLVNITNRSIRVEPDVPWYRAGQLFGMSLLWRIAVDSHDTSVALAAITLIVELQHRTPNRFKASENIKGSFLRQCFKQLYCSIQSLLEGEPEGEEAGSSSPGRKPKEEASSATAAAPAVSTPAAKGSKPQAVKAQLEDWFDDGKSVVSGSVISTRISRLIVTLRRFIHRFYVTPSQLITLRILSGRDESPVLSLTLKSTDTIGLLKSEILKYFKEPAESVAITRTAKTGSLLTSDKLDQADQTLGQLKFSYTESILVSRTEPASAVNGGKSMKSSAESAPKAPAAMQDLFTPQDLSGDVLEAAKGLLTWLGCPEGTTLRGVFQIPRFTARSHVDLQRIADTLSQSSEPPPLPNAGSGAAGADSMERVVEFLAPLVRNSPHYVDQLLEMLDGYLSTEIQSVVGGDFDLSTAVWDILQSLPSHSLLHQSIRDVGEGGTPLTHLLDPMNSYRLLYTLQIVESFLDTDYSQTASKPATSTFGVVDWAAKFFMLGGLDVIVALLKQEVAKVTDMRVETTVEGFAPLSANDGAVVVMARRDKSCVIVGILCRILHRLLLFDSAFRQWQSQPIADDTPEFLLCLNSKIVTGAILSCVDAKDICHSVLSAGLAAVKLFEGNGISSTALGSLAVNSTALVFGLLAAADSGIQILVDFPQFGEWLQSMCYGVQSEEVRSGVAVRVYSGCVNLCRKACTLDLGEEAVRARARMFRHLLNALFECTQRVERASDDRSREQLLSLVACLEALRSAPSMVFIALQVNDNWTFVEEGSDEGLVARARFFVKQFTEYKSCETFHSAQSDGNLAGYLRILLVHANVSDDHRKLLGSDGFANGGSSEGPSDLVSYVYMNCLFSSSSSHASESSAAQLESMVSVCQTKASRTLAYALLYKLCDSDLSNLARLVRVMERLSVGNSYAGQRDESGAEVVKYVRRVGQWDYDPNLLAKDYDSNVGLSNQGGTCYMNSFLQQLYHVTPFTDALLRIPTAAAETDENENLLFQLQVMFGYMRLSQKRYFDTLPFCRAFIDYDGQPVDLGEQKDINEFAGMLFEKLEHNKVCAGLLRDTVQGKIVYRTKSTESSYLSEREEPFYMITAEVKDKATLEDSLELNSAEELFSGDNKIEDAEGRKVDAMRRCAIRSLPSTLIIHLKRFEFDVETMNRKKVNDQMTFPINLNMLPYTEEGLAARDTKTSGLSAAVNPEGGAEEGGESASSAAFSEPVRSSRPEQYYQYELKGVVAHVGAIDRGHYYSFIRDKAGGGVGGRWQEFNDRSVLPFSAEAIARECFGGVDEASGRVRENNAYLLFYERAAPSWGLDSGELGTDSVGSLKGGGSSTAGEAGSSAMARRVTEAVWSENMSFLRDRFLFDNINLRFVWQLYQLKTVDQMLASKSSPVEDGAVTTSGSIPPSSRTLASFLMVGLRFNLEVLVKARAHSCIHLYFERLEEIVVQDTSKQCALAVLGEVAREALFVQDRGPSAVEAAAKSKYRVEREAVEGGLHPWLLQMFVFCPHATSLKAFARFLMSCIKQVRSSCCAGGYLTTRAGTGEGTETPAVFESCVARFFSKLLLMTEKLLVEDAGSSEGYKTATMMLFQFASLGGEERELLLQLGSVYRLVCTMLTINPAANKTADSHLRYCIDLVALLVRNGCLRQQPPEADSSVPWEPLRKEDLLAFMNRVFLEDAIIYCTSEMSLSLQQVCSTYGIKEGLKILEFLSDKVIESTAVSSGTLLTYRPFFRVMTDILLGPALVSILEYTSITTKLFNKAYQLSTRQGANDAELIYSVCKLCHRIGTSSLAGHQAVMKSREFWRDIGLKYANAKKSGGVLSNAATPSKASNAGMNG